MNLASYLASIGNPYTEWRYDGKPHKCLAVCVDRWEQRRELFHLDDFHVSAVVSGGFIELQRKPQTRFAVERDGSLVCRGRVVCSPCGEFTAEDIRELVNTYNKANP